MKKFLTALCALLCAATAVGALAACNKTPTPDDGENQKPPVTPVDPVDQFNGVTEAMPTEGLRVSALSNMKEATSLWQTKFEADAFRVSVWVKDDIVVSGEDAKKSDGVSVWLSQVSTAQGYVAGKTLNIFVAPDGTFRLQRADSAATLAASTENITVSAKQWAESGEIVVGYKAEIVFPYSLLGIKGDAKGKISVAAELYNTSASAFNATVRGASLTEYGVDTANQNTYLVATDDNKFELNAEPYPTGTFSVKKNVYDKTESFWDISEDYLQSDAAYGQRVTALNGSLGTGKYNELWFYKTKGTLFYAESDFSLSEKPVYFGDKYPKFGFTVYDSEKNGVFFYVAADADASGNVSGNSVGYCVMTKGAFDWEGSKMKNIGWSPNQTVRLAVYRNGGTIKLLANDEVAFTLDGTSGIDESEALMPAVFSFNIGMTLTNYRATTDENDEKIAALMQKLPAYEGTITHAYTVLDSTNTAVDLTAYGGYDWAVYGEKATLNPSEIKGAARSSLIGEIGANVPVKSFNDFLYEKSSLVWSDGAKTESANKTGEIAGLTLNGAGAKFVMKFNVLAGSVTTYFVWFGGYEAKTNLRMTDARGNVLFSDSVGSKSGRTVGRLSFTVLSSVDTEITLELTADDDVLSSPQVWLLASSAIATGDIPKDKTEIGVEGTITANIIGRSRNSESIDMTALGTKDWVLYGKESSTNAYRKAGENGYFGNLQCLANYNGMTDFLTGNDVLLSFDDGAAPDTAHTFRGNVPALAMTSESAKMIQYLFVKANEPVRFTLWASSWIGSGVGVKIYDENKTWYENTIPVGGKVSAIDFTVNSKVDACVKVELSATDQIWYLGGVAGAPENVSVSTAEFTGKVKARFAAEDRNNLQVDLSATGTKDWTFFGKSTVRSYEKKNNAISYFGALSAADNNTAYPFADFATGGSLVYTDGLLLNNKNYSGSIPALSLYGNGAKMTLALNVKGSENFSYFLWLGTFNGSMNIDVKTASGASVLKNPVTVTSATSSAAIGCLRLDLTGVNESVLYVEMSCTGQEIWLCAGAAGETPVDPDEAFEGNLKTEAGMIDRMNTSLNLTQIGTYDWNVYRTNKENYAKKNTTNPMIHPVTVKAADWDNDDGMGDFFYQNAGSITWSDGNEGHESMNQSGDFPALKYVFGYRLGYSIPEDFKGTIYLWVGYWETLADMRVTDVEGNLLDFVRMGDALLGNLYEMRIHIDSKVKTTIFVDFDTMEAGKARGLWLFGTAVGEYQGDSSTADFKGSVTFEGASFNRENVSLNFTEQGTLDWVAYNNGSISDFESKNTHAVSPYIGTLTLGAYTEISKEDNFFYNNSGIVGWTDGTKQTQFSSAAGNAFPAIQAGFKSASFTIALKAEAGKSICYSVWTGGWRGQVAANLSDGNGVIAISRAYGSMNDGVDTIRIDVIVTSEVDTTVYLRVYKVTTDYNYNAAQDGANLMIMGVTARYTAVTAFHGSVSANLVTLDRFNTTLNVSEAGKADWHVFNKADIFGYTQKQGVSDSYVGSLSFEGKTVWHFNDFFYENQGVVSWTDGTEGAYASAAGESTGGLSSQDTFVLRLNVKANEKVKFFVWLGGYNNPASTYTLFTEGGKPLANGSFGVGGSGYVGQLELEVENGTDCTLILKINNNGQESWLFGAAASKVE